MSLISHAAAAAQALAEERRSLAGSSPAPIATSAAKSQSKPGTRLNNTDNVPCVSVSLARAIYIRLM